MPLWGLGECLQLTEHVFMLFLMCISLFFCTCSKVLSFDIKELKRFKGMILRIKTEFLKTFEKSLRYKECFFKAFGALRSGG